MDRELWPVVADAAEINEAAKGPDRRSEVIQGRAAPDRALQEQLGQARPVQPRTAQEPRVQGEDRLDHPPGVASEPEGRKRRLRHQVPEATQALQPPVRRVSRDQRGIQCGDRRADQPIRLTSHLSKSLVHTGLEGAERTTAAADERASTPRPWVRPNLPKTFQSLLPRPLGRDLGRVLPGGSVPRVVGDCC